MKGFWTSPSHPNTPRQYQRILNVHSSCIARSANAQVTGRGHWERNEPKRISNPEGKRVRYERDNRPPWLGVDTKTPFRSISSQFHRPRSQTALRAYNVLQPNAGRTLASQ